MDNETLGTRDDHTRLFIVLLVALLLLLAVSFIFDLKIERRDISAPSGAALKTFPEVRLEARAAYVYDIRNQEVLFAKNENTRLSLASLTKVMAALVASELTLPESTIKIGSEALALDGDSGLYRDERWRLRDLLDFSLITSSNDGMRAVALALGAISRSDATTTEIINDFVREMNAKASELGLKNTYFWNETGLDESDVKGGAYGTARDIALLVEHILSERPELLKATREPEQVFESMDKIVHTATNTNSITERIPGLIASKTGATDTAGGNLVIVFDPELGRPIIISVLGSTTEGRFHDIETLVQATLEYITDK